MTRPTARKNCFNCGDPFSGTGLLCPDCTPRGSAAPAPAPAAAAGRPAPSACPYCRRSLSWDDVARAIRRFDGGVFECIYYCGFCRSTLEVANWMNEKS